MLSHDYLSDFLNVLPSERRMYTFPHYFHSRYGTYASRAFIFAVARLQSPSIRKVVTETKSEVFGYSKNFTLLHVYEESL